MASWNILWQGKEEIPILSFSLITEETQIKEGFLLVTN